MSSWGAKPEKGTLFSCPECGEPLTFVPGKRRLRQQEEAAICTRMQEHMAASPVCGCAIAALACEHKLSAPHLLDNFEAVGCRCDKPCFIARDDGVYCVLCNGAVEWKTHSPPTVIWRGVTFYGHNIIAAGAAPAG